MFLLALSLYIIDDIYSSIYPVSLSSIKIKVYKDGNQWCVLHGENIQEGIAGFGDTVDSAIKDFNRNLKE